MDSSDVIAVCAAFIALSATGVSIWQGYLNRVHFRLSVRPHVTVHWNNTSDGRSIFTMFNNGLGPAIIRSFSIEINGQEIKDSGSGIIYEALKSLGVGALECKSFVPSEGEAYAVNSQLVLMDLYDLGEKHEKVKAALALMKFKIAYTSIYNENNFLYRGNC